MNNMSKQSSTMTSTDANYGVIEGFYGHSWSWSERTHYAQFLQLQGFKSYVYAPKSDAFLRSRWPEPWPHSEFEQLLELAQHYRRCNVDFGIALSPLELYRNWNATTQQKLAAKLETIDQIKPDILCILFDDMRGDWPKLADLQVEISHFAKQHSNAKHFILCPTYYSYDPILEDVFGASPSDYWQTLGAKLDPKIEIFWTGDKVCSSEYSCESLVSINQLLQREISLWDNYPVNDGRKTSPFLNLEAFEQRPASLASCTRRHLVNPMNAAHLSKIPLHTLAQSYAQGEAYAPRDAFHRALTAVCESDLAQAIEADLDYFQNIGLEALTETKRSALWNIYQGFDSPQAREICAWLEGYYRFDPACLTD